MTILDFVQKYILALAALIGIIGIGLVFWVERDNPIRKCLDLITAPNGKYSRTAIGQCFGILLAIFAPIYTTLQDKLDPVIYAASLLYLGGVEMYTIYMRQRQKQMDGQDVSSVVTTTPKVP